MYVWEGGLLETTREQDCFKFSLKNTERRQLSGVLWKLIPCRWTRMWKRPFSEFRPKSRLDVTRRVGGAQTKWTWWCICLLEHVGEVRRTATVVYIVHCQAQLVFNSWANRKPVQLAQMSSDVFVIWNVTDEPCGSVLDSLKWLECRLGKARQHRVAVVQSWHDDRQHQTDGDVFSDTVTHLM